MDVVTLVVVLARIALAAVFVVSAVAKLRDRAGSREAVRGFGTPQPLVGAVTIGLPLVELACAGLLVAADPAATLGAIASLLLLTAFTVAIVVNLIRGRRPDCHCFGTMGRGGGIGWNTVARNTVLLALAVASLVGAGSRGSVPAVLVDQAPEHLALSAAVVLGGSAVAVLALAVRVLLVRYGAVLLRLEALELATGTAEPPIAPTFALHDLDGQVVDLQEVLADQRPVVAVFISPSCVHCDDLLHEVAHWQGDPRYPVTVLVISSGTSEANRAKVAELPQLRVLLQRRSEVAKAYGVEGTPAAVLIGVDGRVAGPVEHGVPDVRMLVARVARTMSEASARVPRQDAPSESAASPPAAGDPVPSVEVETESGAAVLLAEVVGAETVLLFWRTTCGFCAKIVDDVAVLESSVRTVLVTSSDLEAVRASGLLSTVVRDRHSALTRALGVPGTPAAVLVRDGSLASALVVGGPGVLDLLQSVRHSASSRSEESDLVSERP